MSISNNLSKKQVHKLFKMLCVHQKEYKAKYAKFPDIWTDCKSCVLRDIPWQLGEGSPIFRDLCFAIWHEDVLNG